MLRETVTIALISSMATVQPVAIQEDEIIFIIYGKPQDISCEIPFIVTEGILLPPSIQNSLSAQVECPPCAHQTHRHMSFKKIMPLPRCRSDFLI